MEVSAQLILVGAGLVLLSIFAGIVSGRVGAPLLLVFLALGMLAGEDGPGGIVFSDFETAFLIGNVALAIILFDGGLRTRAQSFRLAAWPSLLLATLGVAVTAWVTALAAVAVFHVDWTTAFLIGAVVGSTDAAAVFFLLHLHGLRLQRRVTATLEIESGINDPMAVFLTVVCVELLAAGQAPLTWAVAGQFLWQMAGGGIIGGGGGFLLLRLINRLRIADGLYPVFAVAFALSLFALAQVIGASGFLAAYLAGFILGNNPHRASQAVERFHDGLAWLSQIVMFLMLGLLVTPTKLLPELAPALFIALVLMLIARPLAVWICLTPFRFNWREQLFISWVGLRGAVPIFLATLPVLAGLPDALLFFDVAFVVVLVSLLLQGWTVTPVARALSLALPDAVERPEHGELDLPQTLDWRIASFKVDPRSPAGEAPIRELALPPSGRFLTVIRGAQALEPPALDRLMPDDTVIAMVEPDQLPALEFLFAPALRTADREDSGVFGEFTFAAGTPAAAIVDLYGLAVTPAEKLATLGELLQQRLGRLAVVGDRVPVGHVELVVRSMEEERITAVGIELDPGDETRSRMDRLLGAAGPWLRRIRDRWRPPRQAG